MSNEEIENKEMKNDNRDSNNDKKEKKKGFFTRFIDKLDHKMEEKSKCACACNQKSGNKNGKC